MTSEGKSHLIDKYPYQDIPKETNSESGYRVYLTPDGKKLPSVTTIIGLTNHPDDLKGLQAWKDWMGPKRAEMIRNEAANVGTVMHRRLEWWVKGIKKKVGSNHIQQQGFKMSRVIIDNGLRHCRELWGSEVQLYFPGLYAGTADGVMNWKGSPAIIDFKQANKLKTPDLIKNYFLQVAAYGLAHNELYNTNIRTGVIMICTRNLEYQEFVLNGREWDRTVNDWLGRLEKYYSLSKNNSSASVLVSDK